MLTFKLKELRLQLSFLDQKVRFWTSFWTSFGPESKEVLEKKPKQKYKDRKYHQQERFDPVYIKEIRQKVTMEILR